MSADACSSSCSSSSSRVRPRGFGSTRGAIRYRFTIPEPEHRWMQVEATFTQLGSAPLELRMSRSSPVGTRCTISPRTCTPSTHLGPTVANWRRRDPMRPDGPSARTATASGSATGVRRPRGRHLPRNRHEPSAHEHAGAVMWAHGLADRPATLTFEPPAGAHWQVATQLHPDRRRSSSRRPTAVSDGQPGRARPITIRQFAVGPRRFRFALHTDARTQTSTAF